MPQMNIPLTPKNPSGPLRVIMLGRVSTAHQNIENIEASYASNARVLSQMYPGETEIRHFGERGSGWKVNRVTIDEAENEIKTGTWDLVLMEDLSRAWRNPQFQFRLAQLCVDHRTRMICIGDGIDTADPNWETLLGAAVLRHSATVPETRRRVRRTADYQFQLGGMVLKLRYGYRRLTAEEAASGEFGPVGLLVARMPECTPIILEMRQRVLRGESYASIARWLNAAEISPGPYVTGGVWNGPLVRDLLRDPILNGLRRFRMLEYRLTYATGEHKREQNANPQTAECPELAHMTQQEQEELWEAMDRYSPRRTPYGRRGTRRSDSYWPGLHLHCGICGEVCNYVLEQRLRCRHGNLCRGQNRCWNRVQVPAAMVRQFVLPQLLERLQSDPVLYQRLLHEVEQTLQHSGRHSQQQQQRLRNRLRDAERDLEGATTALIRLPESESLQNRQQELEGQVRQLRQELAQLESADERPTWRTRDDIERDLLAVLHHLAATSYPFSRCLRGLIPRLELVPVQAFDTSQVRARIRITWPALAEGGAPDVCEIDAFTPPQHIRQAVQYQRLRQAETQLTLLEIGQRLGLSKAERSRAQRYLELMEAAGSTAPYRELTAPPTNASRWRPQGRNSPPSPPEATGDAA